MRGSNPSIEAIPALGNASIRFLWLGPTFVAAVTFLGVLLTLDPAGDRPGLPQGPGLTTDEVLNVEAGLMLWNDLRGLGWALIDPVSWYEVYSTPYYQSDYPPLGRLILAASHELMQVLWPVQTDPSLSPRPYYTIQARAASALAFAVTVWLVGWYSSRWFGRLAGIASALAVPLMPRLFAHAHIASIESIVGLFFTWTVLDTVDRWPKAFRAFQQSPGLRSEWSIPWRPAVVTGCLLGLTLLTKIQAVLFPIPFAVWAMLRFGRRGITGVATVGVISALVLLTGWPWLWIDPWSHFWHYLLPADRDHLYCWYLGQRFLDCDVPWHYSFVMFLVTVPIGLQFLGGFGIVTTCRLWRVRFAASGPAMDLLACVIFFPLVLFSLPKMTVYDGERLFLVCFPLWAVLIGLGVDFFCGRTTSDHANSGQASLLTSSWRWGAKLTTVVGLLFCESGSLFTLHPCQLSYYSWAIGGLRGASSMGLERTYWGDSITRELHQKIVEQVPRGATIHVAPVLHPLQLTGMALQSPLLQKHQITLEAYDDSIREQVRYVLVFRRLADPRSSLDEPTTRVENGGFMSTAPAGFTRLAEVRRDAVQLAVLYTARGHD